MRPSRGAAFLLLACLAGCANGMFYQPAREAAGSPASFGLAYEEVSFRSRDGTALSGWFVPAVGKAKGTVVHFHGNAENMASHFSYVNWLPSEGFNVFTFDYRGYGASEGTPDRRGVFEDCIAAVEAVRSRPGVDPDALLLLGQSLGGANAAALAGEGRGAGVIAVAIDSAFHSYRLIARDKIRDIPVLSLLRWPLSFLVVTDGHSPGPVVGRISPVPLLIFHGTDDAVVPFRHGQMLFEAAKEPKTFVPIPEGRHTDAFRRAEDAYRKRLVAFYEAALERKKAAGP